MKKNQGQNNSIPALAALLVFGIFAVCILAVLLLGADTYKNLSRRDAAVFDERVCAQYLTMKVRQAPSGMAVHVDEGRGDGPDILVLAEPGADGEADGGQYLTLIYCCDGWLWEYFTPVSALEELGGIGALREEGLSAGEKIMPSASLSVKLDDALLEMELISQEKETLSLKMYLHCTKEGEGL